MLQGYLTKLDMGSLVSAGMVSINVLFSNAMQVCPFSMPTRCHPHISLCAVALLLILSYNFLRKRQTGETVMASCIM